MDQELAQRCLHVQQAASWHQIHLQTARRRLAAVEGCLMSKDDKFLAGKSLGGRPAVVEERLNRPVKPHKPKVLSPQEWKFVEEFVAGDGHVTLKEAALRAGYSSSWAQSRARELTDPDTNPHIVAAIQERRRELGEKYATTFERHMRDLQVIRDQALTAGAYGAAVQAEYRRGQALGTIYIDRKEIRHGTIDSMSKEEVQRKLEEIKRLYGGQAGPIVDVTPKQIEEEPEEEDTNGPETGSEPVQEGPGKYPKLPFHPD
jgi:phage terminase small subunit